MLKTFWLFQKNAPANSRSKAAIFWVWNTGLVLLSGACLGVMLLIYAFGHYDFRLFGSYLANPKILLLNLLPILALQVVLWLVTGRAALAFFLTSAVGMGFSLANYFMLLFRDDPLMFQDLKYLREAGTITRTANYDLSLDARIAAGLACVAVGTLVLALLARGRPRLRPRLILAAVAVLACLPLGSVYADAQTYDTDTRNLAYINQWSSTQQYISRGFVYPFLHSVTDGAAKPPAGYSEAEAAALLAEYADADIPDERKVDLVMLQLEAFADFSRFENVGGVDWASAYATYHAIEAESYTGDLITSIFAGGTVKTERSVLTGYAAQENYRSNTNSYAWYLQSQGYVAEGAHPCYQWFYNRRNVNGYLGLPTYYFLENRYQELFNAIAADNQLLPDIFHLYETHCAASDAPYFSFNVTYQGHGPYSTEDVWRGNHYTDGRYSTETANIVDNYLGSVADTAEQLRLLLDAFQQEERPVVVVAFGDHMPWLGDGNSAYQELGVNLDTSTEAGFRNYYGTRYLIWANDAAKARLGEDFTGQGPDLSPNYLMNQVFALCGWQGDAYLQATEDLRRALPVVTGAGWYGEHTENGAVTLSETLSDEAAEALRRFRALEYYDSHHFRYEG